MKPPMSDNLQWGFYVLYVSPASLEEGAMWNKLQSVKQTDTTSPSVEWYVLAVYY